MRRPIIAAAFVLIFMVGIANHAFSAEKSLPPAKKYFVEDYTLIAQTSGNVVRVDAGGRPAVLISTYDGRTLYLLINSETELLKAGKSVKLPEIKKGDLAAVSYEVVYRDKIIAKFIHVK